MQKMTAIWLLGGFFCVQAEPAYAADNEATGKALTSAVTVKVSPDLKESMSLDLGNGVKMDLVLIRPGAFMMGDKDAKPVHKVVLMKPFYMGKFEVTQEQWQAVMGDNPSNFKDGADAGKRPVEKVSWEDINAKFLPKLAERIAKGLIPRLPTEAEWEYSCRAGTTGDYAGELDEMGWHNRNSGKTTHPVGQKKPNAWGLYDMHGNVWEWCSDWYGDYPANDVTDPAGASSGKFRAYRGGAWFYIDGGCRSAFRGWISPETRMYNIG
ncbi:MAG: formylglycine-generating enzyme family protein, partial [Victivallales bacterium]